MGLAKLKTKISIEDYLEGEETSPIKHEFIDGEVFAMAGASERNHRISLNLTKRLDDHLENSSCQVFMAEMRLQADEKTFYYPDVFVACDHPPKSEFYREEPVLIIEVVSPSTIEVVSPSTRQIDRREKLRIYQQIPTVREYVVIEQDKMHIEIHRRQSDGRWITYLYNESDLDKQIEFQSINLSLNLEEIYNRVRFES